MERIELASSQFPSGVAWLLNFFVENNILIYRGENVENTWAQKDGTYNLRAGEEILKQWVPCLSEKTCLRFKTELAIRWSHEFPDSKNTRNKVILLVRDGRDCIYSLFKREKKFENLSQMLGAKTNPFGLPPPETWAWHGYSWKKSVIPERLFIIKFEEIKSDPFPVLKRLVAFLGIHLTDEEIFRGIESSGFDRAKKAEEEYRKNNANVQYEAVNRKGQPGEWREVYTEKELAFFDGFPNSILKQFNYQDVGNSIFSASIFWRIYLRIIFNKIKAIWYWPISKAIIVYKKLFS